MKLGCKDKYKIRVCGEDSIPLIKFENRFLKNQNQIIKFSNKWCSPLMMFFIGLGEGGGYVVISLVWK